ncbi:MAG: TonB-dependent receptor, partial [Flavobacteriaceae bacterium]
SITYANSQNKIEKTKLSINLEDATLVQIFSKLSEITDYQFTYGEYILENKNKYDAVFTNTSLRSVLSRLGENAKFDYFVEGSIVTIKKSITNSNVRKTLNQQGFAVSGTITDENGQPLPGANVLEKGTTNGTITDFEGLYSITVTDENTSLIISYIGYTQQEIAVNGQSKVNIRLSPDSQQLDEVVLTGVRRSLAKALVQKRTAVGVVDGIAAEDIADFPDLNISESLQRITGVSINRQLGEGQQVSVRGLAPEFTRVTINGQTVTSGNPGREVDFDVFASELFNNVQLSKSPSASLTEGGLAATVDLRTSRPFDFNDDGTVYALSAQGVINDLREDLAPRLSFLVSNNNLAEGKLGLLASVSYSESNLRQDNVEGLRFLLLPEIDEGGDGTVDFINGEIPFIPRYVLEFLDRDRLGLTAALQFKPTADFGINFDAAYAKFDEVRTRYSIDGLLSGNRSTPNSASVDRTGLVTRATYDNVSSRSENIRTPSEEDLILLNLDNYWRFGNNWELRGKLGYSKATKTSDEFRAVYNAVDTFTYDFSDRIFVSLEPENTDFTDPGDFAHNQSRFIYNEIDDQETSAQFDLIKRFDDGFFNKLSSGIRFSDREKSQIRYDGRFTARDDNGNPLSVSSAIASSLPVNDFFHQYDNPDIVRTWFVTDFDAVFADPAIGGKNFEVPQRFISTFTVNEKSFAGYVQTDFRGKIGELPIRGNLGLRLVNTEQSSDGFLGDGTPVTEGKSYTELLPSLNTVFNLSDNFLGRFTLSRSLTRPTLTELSPGGTVAPGNAVPGIGGGTANLGNPLLDPFTATQVDISFEWYFAEEALLSATFFNKNVDNFIVDVTEERLINVGSLLNDNGEEVGDSPFFVTQPINGEQASITGVELSLQLPFSLITSSLDGYGTLINYTYSDSEAEIPFNGEIFKTLLPGQSQSSFNVIGYFEKDGFSTRLAYSWRDKFLDQVRPAQNQRSNFYDAYGQLDANVQYELTNNITIIGNALNLLENETYRYAERTDRNISYRETGRFFTFGVRAKF